VVLLGFGFWLGIFWHLASDFGSLSYSFHAGSLTRRKGKVFVVKWTFYYESGLLITKELREG